MDTNPFEVAVDPMFEDDECLHSHITEMVQANRLAKIFNPLHHRIANWVTSKIAAPKRRTIYSDSYVGEDRRQGFRVEQAIEELEDYVKILFMTKTQKILIEE